MDRRIAFIADRIEHWNAGTERQMLLLSNHLTRLGWTVPLIVLRRTEASSDGRWPGDTEDAGIGSLSSPVAWMKAFLLAIRLRKNGFRLVQLYYNDTSLLLPPFMRLLGIKVIVSRRDMGIWYTPGRLWLLRLLRPTINLVIANSRAVANYASEQEGFRQEQVVVCLNGLIEDSPSESPKIAVDDPGPVVGVVANIRPVKRLEDAVLAFAKIADRHESAELHIVGGGDATALAELATRCGIGDRVILKGRVESPAAEIAGFSVAMLTSESEGLSNSMIEYMHAAKPVICTDAGGNPELVEDGVTGFLCEVGDTLGMAEKLDALFSDRDLRAKMGGRARERIRTLCDPDLAAGRHERMYLELLVAGASGEGHPTVAKRP